MAISKQIISHRDTRSSKRKQLKVWLDTIVWSEEPSMIVCLSYTLNNSNSFNKFTPTWTTQIIYCHRMWVKLGGNKNNNLKLLREFYLSMTLAWNVSTHMTIRYCKFVGWVILTWGSSTWSSRTLHERTYKVIYLVCRHIFGSFCLTLSNILPNCKILQQAWKHFLHPLLEESPTHTLIPSLPSSWPHIRPQIMEEYIHRLQTIYPHESR